MIQLHYINRIVHNQPMHCKEKKAIQILFLHLLLFDDNLLSCHGFINIPKGLAKDTPKGLAKKTSLRV